MGWWGHDFTDDRPVADIVCMGSRKQKTSKKRSGTSAGLAQRVRSGLKGGSGTESGRRMGTLLAWVAFAAVVVVGMWCLERYVVQAAREREVELTASMTNPPRWASDELVREILLSSAIRHDDFLLDERLTTRWAKNLSRNPWVKKINCVRKHYSGEVTFDCELRRPIAMVRQGLLTRYIDAEGVVLPDATLVQPYGHVIELHGAVAAMPEPGESLRDAALIAGIQVLAWIRGVDEQLDVKDRLWSELAVLDVANHNGRVDQAKSHLTFYTKNNTEVRWGAAIGRSVPYGEASAKCKISTLYRKHELAGSLELFPYVELRDPPKDRG